MSVLGQVWLQAYCAFITGGSAKTIGDASTLADFAVEEYKKRFVTQQDRGPLVPR